MYISATDTKRINQTIEDIIDGKIYPQDINGKKLDSIMDSLESLGSVHEERYCRMEYRVILRPIVMRAWGEFHETINTLIMLKIDWEMVWRMHVGQALIRKG
jgi:hypothetical protein